MPKPATKTLWTCVFGATLSLVPFEEHLYIQICLHDKIPDLRIEPRRPEAASPSVRIPPSHLAVGAVMQRIATEPADAGIIGEMAVNQTLLAEIVARILTVARPDRIILFGSAASGEMTKDSDIDLLIVEPAPGNRHDEAVRVRDAIGNIDYPVDVLIMATDRFEATRHVIGGIAYPANKYGRVLYAAA